VKEKNQRDNREIQKNRMFNKKDDDRRRNKEEFDKLKSIVVD